MRVSVHIGLLFILLLASTAAGYFVLKSVNPFEASTGEYAVFYLTLFVWIFSAAAIAGFGLRYIFQGVQPKYLIHSSIRHGVLLGMLAITALFLQSSEMLSVWTGLLLVVIFTLVEIYVR